MQKHRSDKGCPAWNNYKFGGKRFALERNCRNKAELVNRHFGGNAIKRLLPEKGKNTGSDNQPYDYRPSARGIFIKKRGEKHHFIRR